jgi:diguanylate cyclase (GGDEF)-like protein
MAGMEHQISACRQVALRQANFMSFQFPSLKSLTIGILVVLGVLSITTLFVTTFYFHNAALNLQNRTMSRVVNVASQEVLKQVHDSAFALGTQLQGSKEFRVSLERLKQSKGRTEIQKILDNTFLHGSSDASRIDLVKLRMYGPDLKWLAESSLGLKDLGTQFDLALLRQASGRHGADQLKALGGLWLSPSGPLYSMLLPLGGLRISGYLEVVVNPLFNLPSVEKMTRMPLTIYGADGKMLFQSPDSSMKRDKNSVRIDYVLRASNGEPAYRLVSMEDVEQFDLDMARTETIAALSFIALIVLGIIAGLWSFNRFLFRPMQVMQNEMERAVQGDFSATVGNHTLKEFHALASAFNTMLLKVADNIRQLQQLSFIDGLTGISNRRQFDLSLLAEWQRALRNQQDLSLIMLDIDYFKRYNDSYGHPAGDECLRIMGSMLRRIVKRSTDVLARYGGEEFVILLPDTSAQGAGLIAERIADELAMLNLPHKASSLGGKLTVSMGCATCKVSRGSKPDILVAAADEALYQAKGAGRNRFVATDFTAAN